MWPSRPLGRSRSATTTRSIARQETITFGRYGVGGITLAEARERLGEAKKMIAAGKSLAKEKARDKARVKDTETFGAWSEKWLRG